MKDRETRRQEERKKGRKEDKKLTAKTQSTQRMFEFSACFASLRFISAQRQPTTLLLDERQVDLGTLRFLPVINGSRTDKAKVNGQVID